jgi:hypothetical protein
MDGTEGPDPLLGRSLGVLDPGRWDPTYWFRFRGRVMMAAARELARRRMTADTTVSDLVVSWARTLVPTALLAAAVAAFIVFRSQAAPSLVPLSVEEILADGIGGTPIPSELTSEEQLTAGGVMFASEAY